ncbi:MAG: 23S rRNA (pseudouridine(1915)-N(3))-methyltransferase RlmH [Sulfurospirillaceae bacterium]|nr:23S rRNA (pseudouridine(1915)-N(3))-methyltransferase RlmH [Sulfurospirillaceae bacterium]
MKIKIFTIEKSANGAIETLGKEYQKMISRFADVEEIKIFSKDISQAQVRGEQEAKASYSRAYEPYLKGFNVSLDVLGKEMDSFEFSEIFSHEATVNFFIGGAFGLESEFLTKTQRIISLSRLTYAHKIAKVVLLEQIYRGLCIQNNHPYHKN